MRRTLPIFVFICMILIGIGIYRHFSKRTETAQILEKLCLGKPGMESLRQLDILKNASDKPVSAKYIPVQIFARPDDRYHWKWLGTGAIIQGRPYLITAAHVMQAHNNIQYGYRVISKTVLEGGTPILPILDCSTHSTPTDVAMCRIALQPSQGRSISFTTKKEMHFVNKKIPVGTTFGKNSGEITLISNGQKIATSFMASVNSNTLVFWQSDFMTPGESGSVAIYTDKSGLTAPMLLHGSIWPSDSLAKALGLKKGSNLIYGSLLNF